MTVYVGGGYAAQETADTVFEASAVRQRGRIIIAREKIKSKLIAMVINVPSNSPACRFAKGNEIEMHLLAVKPEYRCKGIGKLLIAASIKDAKIYDCSKVVLWTQQTMKAAHRLYESSGFVHIPVKDFTKNNRKFLFYECLIN